MSHNYKENGAISRLRDEQQVRQRPGVIFGTNDVHGCAHSVFEIIANSIDEAREGYGETIEITVDSDNTVKVKDNGRGVPMAWNERESQFNWELVFCTLYASGKLDSSNYQSSLGLNGLGATATQFASEFMDVISVRDGKSYTMHFKEGKPVGELSVQDTDAQSGTEITFRPDTRVFKDIDVPVEHYITKLRSTAMLHPNIRILLSYKELNDIELYFPGGAAEFIQQNCEKPIIPDSAVFTGEAVGTDDPEEEDYKLTMEVAINFSRDIAFCELYHNGSHMSDGGVTNDALWGSVIKVIEDEARSRSKIGKSERLSTRDIEEIFIAIGVTNCPGHRTYFKNQTKTAINNTFIRKAYAEFVYYNFSRWMEDNKTYADRIVAEVIANKEAREAAEAVKKKAIKKLTAGIDKFGNRPKKFVECSSKNPRDREVYIVEGDSAAGSCKLARDSNFQAIMPIRGKIMNCLKESLERSIGSEIIMDLMSVLGCGIEAESKHIKDLPKFDIMKLNWNKVIICTDADLDGMQIRCLLIAMVYRLVPSLLKAGKIFIALTPLFEITAKGQSYFAYDEAEKTKIMGQLANMGIRESQIQVQRSKGLGENDPEMMSYTTMKPESRRLIQVVYNENEHERVDVIFEALLGNDIDGRKQLIDTYFSSAVVME